MWQGKTWQLPAWHAAGRRQRLDRPHHRDMSTANRSEIDALDRPGDVSRTPSIDSSRTRHRLFLSPLLSSICLDHGAITYISLESLSVPGQTVEHLSIDQDLSPCIAILLVSSPAMSFLVDWLFDVLASLGL